MSDWRAEAEALRNAAPRGWLFLCVANSARSQLAEGIARALAPDDVWVGSAGSEPTSVRPEAIQVLAEIGVDITGHRSKGMHEIPADRVEAVVTLCAGEVCPVWLGHAHRVHWGLPDPAAARGWCSGGSVPFPSSRGFICHTADRGNPRGKP